jgi:mono/diheme cytochrome c family protein
MTKFIFACAFLITATIGCGKKKDNEESTTAAKKWADVEPILKENCLSCHGTTAEPHDLASKESVFKANLANVKKCIKGECDKTETGYEVMPPPPSTKLSDADIATIEAYTGE